jgi:serine/threonine protein kinase
VKCPKCHTENTADSGFCKKCATPLPASEEIPVAQTETLQAPIKELTSGSTFANRYQIIEELGKGGMGRVYKVFDQEVQAKMALKLIKPEVSADKNTIDRFRNELKIARDISHKNICRMYDLGREAGNYFITMEYVSGEDLKSFIRRSRQLVVGTAVFIAKQVSEGLAEAHRLGVVHRDLKPGNIMIDKEGNAKIMDFGIARSISVKGITGTGVMIGTPEYMSPEQVEGKEVDQRSDIYSLGIILYEMLTGQVPFEGDTPFTVGVKQKSEIPKDPKSLNAQIPQDLSRLILKCLEKDKERRYQNADELRANLEKIEQGIPTAERPVPKRKTVTSKPITVTLSRKKLLIPTVVIALVAIAAIIWFAFLKKEVPLLPEQKRSIAVISFENQTGDKAYDNLSKVIQNLLITNLEQSGYFYVATWERLRDLLKQMGKGDVEFIASDLGFEICKMDGVNALVLGSYAKAGNTFVTNAQVLDVGTKNLLGTAS